MLVAPQKANAEISVRRRTGTAGRRDLLSRFFQIQKESPDVFDDLDNQILATLNIFAGSDTTSIALHDILYCPIRHRRCRTSS
jgi:cytochrome P450